MRRALLLLMTGTALALPAASSAQVPRQDSVSLSGIASAGNFTIRTLEATSGSSGESPSGQIRFDVFGGSIVQSGPVSCLAVDGNTAIIEFVNEGDLFPGLATTVRVIDGQPDEFVVFFPFGGDPTDCSLTGLTPSGFEGPVSGGDFTVVDAPPLPTTKDQCKGSGWKTYGVFKNQGDCVSFVATGAKNPPGKS